MQSKEILEAGLSVEWAVINPSQSNKARSESEFTSVEPNRILFGKRVSGLHYNLRTNNGGTWSFDKNDFSTTNERSFGFMVELPARNDQETPRYVVIKPTNFIETKSNYNAYWEPKLAQRALEEEERRRQREIRQANENRRSEILSQRKVAHNAERERLEESVKQSIGVLLGQGALTQTYVDTDLDYHWLNVDTPEEQLIFTTKGYVRLDIKQFLRLIEKVGN
jgi:hypothetical protein